MKIGIDLSICGVGQAGTGIYAQYLTETLSDLDSENDIEIFSVNKNYFGTTAKKPRGRLEGFYREILYNQWILPRKARRAKLDVLHMPANLGPMFPPCPMVVTILDASVFRYPQYFTRVHRTKMKILVPRVARKAHHILTISEHAKLEIVHFLEIPPEKVTVTYLAVSSAFCPLSAEDIDKTRRKYDLPKRFVLSVCTLEPRKNIIQLLRAFAQLRKKGIDCPLVHTGAKGWLCEEIFAEAEHLNLGSSVRFLGRVSLQDLISLYNSATVFAYPSLYEGFGIPVLEAMACGCPVVTSNVSSIPEVIGDAGIMIDPDDEESLAAALRQVLDNPDKAETMRKSGIERAKRFSWERCARETLSVYQQVAG